MIADRTANANANNQVSLSHLTNTGNGSDTFINVQMLPLVTNMTSVIKSLS
jgi:hypothetical protein